MVEPSMISAGIGLLPWLLLDVQRRPGAKGCARLDGTAPASHHQANRGAAMPEEPPPRPIAVLIDAANTSPRIAAGLFEEIAKFGEASARRIYGDFSSPRMKSWADILQKYAIDPHQQFAYTTGK